MTPTPFDPTLMAHRPGKLIRTCIVLSSQSPYCPTCHHHVFPHSRFACRSQTTPRLSAQSTGWKLLRRPLCLASVLHKAVTPRFQGHNERTVRTKRCKLGGECWCTCIHSIIFPPLGTLWKFILFRLNHIFLGTSSDQRSIIYDWRLVGYPTLRVCFTLRYRPPTWPQLYAPTSRWSMVVGFGPRCTGLQGKSSTSLLIDLIFRQIQTQLFDPEFDGHDYPRSRVDPINVLFSWTHRIIKLPFQNTSCPPIVFDMIQTLRRKLLNDRICAEDKDATSHVPSLNPKHTTLPRPTDRSSSPGDIPYSSDTFRTHALLHTAYIRLQYAPTPPVNNPFTGYYSKLLYFGIPLKQVFLDVISARLVRTEMTWLEDAEIHTYLGGFIDSLVSQISFFTRC